MNNEVSLLPAGMNNVNVSGAGKRIGNRNRVDSLVDHLGIQSPPPQRNINIETEGNRNKNINEEDLQFTQGKSGRGRKGDSYITQHHHSGELRSVMNKVVTEEWNGYKINIDQEGVGLDQIQAFQNMDRANTLDYNHNSIPSYERTEGYRKRLKQHNEWLLKMDM